MALIKFAGGPLDGQEKETQDPGNLAAEYPGYAAVEQVSDPDRGQLLKTEWRGNQVAEANYPGSPQEAERRGNETGVRTQEDPNRGETVNRTGGNETTGAQKRDARNETSDAKRRGAKGGDGNK